MSDILSSDGKKPMEQSENDLSEAISQLSVTKDDSHEASISLSDMPVDVVRPIIEKLDYRQQLKLRKVSTSLRALVDNRKSACKSIKVACSEDNVIIHFNEQGVMYVNHQYDYEKNWICTGRIVPFQWILRRKDFEKAALDDLTSTLKNPKLHLKKFSVSFGVIDKKDFDKFCKEIRNLLKALDHQVSVKEFELKVSSPSCLRALLSFLKPGLLEKIKLDFDATGVTGADLRNDSDGMKQVALLEQWKQAKVLEMWDLFDVFPLEHATHFKRYNLDGRFIGEDKFIRITEFLSKLDNFEQCTLSCLSFRVNGLQVLGAPVSSNATEEVFHHPIPDSDCFLEFTKPINGYEAKIVKKKRENN
ncbi:unnamed protein product [Caenorhabditis brenneri]